MPLKIKILALFSLFSLFLFFSPRLELKLLSYAFLIFSLSFLFFSEAKERIEKEKKAKALLELKHLYDDLDEQAKLIVQTDLRLGKTEEELSKRISGLYILQDIGRVISNTKNFFDPSTQRFNLKYSLDKITKSISKALVERLEFEKSVIFLVDKENLKVNYCNGEGYSFQEQEKINDEKVLFSFLEEKEIKEVISKRSSTLVEDISSFPSKLEEKINSFFNVSSFAIVPIIVQGNIIGSIFVGNGLHYDKIDEQDLEFLSILAEQTGVALGNIYLHQETIEALDANPLTKLPGNISINRKLRDCVARKLPFAVCYVDIDEFKAFNDRYGFEMGDKAIQQTTNILSNALKTEGNPDDFIGHIGGDDFILLTAPDKFESLCEEAIKNFNKRVPSLYDSEDRKNGYIISRTRQGKVRKFPLMSISIAVVSNTHRKIAHVAQIGELGAELKKYAKSFKGSVWVEDKRRGKRRKRNNAHDKRMIERRNKEKK